MKDKIFRVNGEIAKEVEKMAVDYVARNEKIITEAKILEAIICVGKEKIKSEDIDEYINSKY